MMNWTKYQVYLIFVVVMSGTVNFLLIQWGSKQKAMGTLKRHTFDHIFIWAEGMFIGEFGCLGMYYILQWYKRRYGNNFQEPVQFNPLIFLPPSLMDMGGTITMYVGLHMTFKYNVQTFRGATVIFAAFLSVTVLRRVITKTMWAGITTVLVGLTLVGVIEGICHPDITLNSPNWKIAGALFIILSRVLLAIQITYEEHFMKKYDIAPLQAIGLEGVFGMTILGIFLIPLYYMDGGCCFFQSNPYNSVEDVMEAFEQMNNNKNIILAMVGCTISIAFYNFSAISLTKEQDATTSIMIDTIRIVVSWLMSMAVGWTDFIGYQVIAYSMQIVGICIYCDVLFIPLVKKFRARHRSSSSSHSINSDDVVSNAYDGNTPLIRPPTEPTETLQSIVTNVVRAR